MKKILQKAAVCALISINGFSYTAGGFLSTHKEIIKASCIAGLALYTGHSIGHTQGHKEGLQEVITKLGVKNYPKDPHSPIGQRVRNFASHYKGALIAAGLTGVAVGCYYWHSNALFNGLLSQITKISGVFEGQPRVIKKSLGRNGIVIGLIENPSLISRVKPYLFVLQPLSCFNKNSENSMPDSMPENLNKLTKALLSATQEPEFLHTQDTSIDYFFNLIK